MLPYSMSLILSIKVYCDMTSSAYGWTLIARFSNNDTKRWMNDTGFWWYDRNISFGITTDSSHNADMISPAFWLVRGNELKITRSDDHQHVALLQTIGNCLGGQTFRSKITAFGNFRNGAIWTSNRCLGNCIVQYGGQYTTTGGFKEATCKGNIQGANAIGFWCSWSRGDGAVMMIGGGGSSCARADHGIGITEADAASFDDAGTEEYDFGEEANSAQDKTYSLNLWIR